MRWLPDTHKLLGVVVTPGIGVIVLVGVAGVVGPASALLRVHWQLTWPSLKITCQ
jgi:hypothetical protein